MIEYLRKTAHEAAQKVDKWSPGTWVVADAPTRDDIDFLTEKFGLDRNTLRDVLDPDEVPRIERIDETVYIFLRSAHQKSKGHSTTTPMLCVLHGDMLITLTQARPACIDKFLEADNTVSTKSNTTLMLHLLQHTFDEYDGFIKDISREIQKIINKMQRRKLENEDFVSFVMIDDQLRNFLAALTPMTPILRRMIVGRTKLNREQTDLVEDIALGIEQSINSCNSSEGRIVSIREAYSTLSNNSLNRTMKTLAALALIVAVPNVIFSMYGMNVALPLQHHTWIYPAIVVATILIIVVAWIAARRRKWL